MVNNMVDVVSIEILQDRDNDGSVSNGCDIGDTPPGVISSDQGDFITSTDAGLFEEQV